MAMEYAYKADRPPVGDVSTVDGLLPGELVYLQEGGGLKKAAFADGRIDGVIEDFADAHLADHEHDFRSGLDSFTYDIDMMTQLGGYEDGSYMRVLTPTDNGTDPAPNIQGWSVVGVADAGTAYAGRVVEEGYTDAASTPVTYNRSNGNFLPLGLAYGNQADVPETNYDSLVHVIRRKEL